MMFKTLTFETHIKFIHIKKFIPIIAAIGILAIGCEDEQHPCPGCTLSPDLGPCEAYIPRFYFDPSDGQCKEFIWGGCDGTVPFQSMAECEACRCEDD